jgi:hypothetical protein
MLLAQCTSCLPLVSLSSNVFTLSQISPIVAYISNLRRWLLDLPQSFCRQPHHRMSDGSYNENIALDVCSCAAVFRDKVSNESACVTWVKKSDAHTTDNYRAKLLGAISIQLILKVASDGKYIPRNLRPQCGCDNKTIVYHGNHPCRPMPAKQAQADLLRYYKRLVYDAP